MPHEDCPDKSNACSLWLIWHGNHLVSSPHLWRADSIIHGPLHAFSKFRWSNQKMLEFSLLSWGHRLLWLWWLCFDSIYSTPYCFWYCRYQNPDSFCESISEDPINKTMDIQILIEFPVFELFHPQLRGSINRGSHQPSRGSISLRPLGVVPPGLNHPADQPIVEEWKMPNKEL